MDLNTYKKYIQILNEELVPAMGCTEPIAIAYAAAKARDVLGTFPESVIVKCSGNMIKNARCVTVPNTGDLVGIEASAIIGILAGIFTGLGLGGGSVLILFLTLFLNLEQHIAQATNLLFFIPSALVCIILNTKRKLINFKNAMFFIVFGVIGAVCGAVVSRDMPVTKLRKLFGVFLLFISAYEIYSYFKLYIKGKKRQY